MGFLLFHRCLWHSQQLPKLLRNQIFLTWLYQSAISLACKVFKSDNSDDILTSVGSTSSWSCPETYHQTSHYMFWMNDFAALFTDESKRRNFLVRLWVTITTSQLFSQHSYLALSRCPFLLNIVALTGNICHVWHTFQVGKNYLFEKLHRFFCVRPMIFCKHWRKGRGNKFAGSAISLWCRWPRK